MGKDLWRCVEDIGDTRGAGEEHAPERPVLTVDQVFDLAERVGRRPVGNVRKVSTGGYRLRFRRDGNMRTAPQALDSRAAAERALWDMADGGRADFNHHGASAPWCS